MDQPIHAGITNFWFIIAIVGFVGIVTLAILAWNHRSGDSLAVLGALAILSGGALLFDWVFAGFTLKDYPQPLAYATTFEPWSFWLAIGYLLTAVVCSGCIGYIKDTSH